MTFVNRDGVRLYWSSEGEGKPLLLLNSIGTTASLWDKVVPYLGAYRLIRLDTRGHGLSDAPEGDYGLDDLASDVIAVLDAAGIQKAAIAGVSLGGMVAMQTALDHADRVSAIALVCTSAKMDRPAWEQRMKLVRFGGMAAVSKLAMTRFLSAEFREHHPEETLRLTRELEAVPSAGYAGCAAAIRDMDLQSRLAAIDTPTLVVVGTADTSTPFEGHGEHLAAAIRNASLAALQCGHLAPLEAPIELARALIHFLSSASDARSDRDEAGSSNGHPSPALET